ncbi:MAG: hypothetical protein M9965_11990 [Anaerolineae bacterium]|nr:hypothetical protein [Anaerolineae bacterium]
MTTHDLAGVACTFSADAHIQIHRIQSAETWITVSQGRHWFADDGLHVLVMLPDGHVGELLLNRETLTWETVGANREQRTTV